MLRLLPLIVQCGFHASLYSLNILLEYIENLKALKLDPKTLTIPTKKKMCEGFISSFLIGIIPCITLTENCLRLTSFKDIYINKTAAPIRKFWKIFLPRPYCRGFSINKQFIIIFTAKFS